jgi:hypothetical protein
METFRLARVVVALCALLILSHWTTAASADSKEEVAATATWFESLEWPDVRDKPYVEITWGKAYIGAKEVEGPKIRGFLLAKDDQSITVLSDGAVVAPSHFGDNAWPFVPQRIKTTAPGVSPVYKVHYRTIGLAQVVKEVLDRFRSPKEPDEERRSHFGRKTSDRTAAFFLARCCTKQGRTDLAAQLDEMALAAKFQLRGNSGQESFRAGIEKEIAHVLMWKTVVDCGETDMSRPQLLAQFERIVRDFPASEHRERATGFIEMLRKMISEDEAHARAARPLAEMSEKEKIAELIFQLRDQNGRQFSQPGSCDIFNDFGQGRKGNTPAHQLVKLGYPAVPALIEALGDTRLSRSVGYHRDFYFSHFVLTVGDCAEAILGRISGRRFWVARTTSAAMQKDGQMKATRAAIEEWWREYEKKGEKQMLIEGVRKGADDSAQQVSRLRELDPSAAIEAIGRGIRAANSQHVRTQLVEEMGRIKSDEATQALGVEMRENTSLNARVAAAGELFRRGDDKTVPAMIEAWSNWTPSQKSGPDEEWRSGESLIQFLGSCGHVSAIKALADRFPSLPIASKFTVLEAATGTDVFLKDETLRKTPRPADVDALAEDLAIAALDDRQVRYGMSGNRGKSSYRDPRVCDMAAGALATRWPQRYQFHWLPTRLQRDPEIAAMRNIWRASRGLPPLTLPPPLKATGTGHPDAIVSFRWTGGPPLAEIPIAEGRAVTADSLIETLIRLHRELPEGRVGFEFILERAPAGPGFVVDIVWNAPPAANPGGVWMAGGGWSHTTNIALDHDSLYNSSGGSSLEHRSQASGYDAEKRALIKALAADSKQAISVTFSTQLSKN